MQNFGKTVNTNRIIIFDYTNCIEQKAKKVRRGKTTAREIGHEASHPQNHLGRFTNTSPHGKAPERLLRAVKQVFGRKLYHHRHFKGGYMLVRKLLHKLAGK